MLSTLQLKAYGEGSQRYKTGPLKLHQHTHGYLMPCASLQVAQQSRLAERDENCPYGNVQQYFCKSMAEIETRFLAGFWLFLAIITAIIQL